MRAFLTILILSAIALTSCEEEIFTDAADSQTVINCFFSPDDTLRLHLSQTYNVFSKDTIQNIYGADISLYSSETLLGQLMPDIPDLYDKRAGYYYYPSLTLQNGSKYQIIYKDEKGNVSEASDVIPLTIPIKNVDTSTSYDENKWKMLKIKLVFDDPVNSENYYAIAINYRSNWVNGFYHPYFNFECSSSIIEADLVGKIACGQVVFSDKQFNGKEENIELVTRDYYSNADSVVFEVMLLSISESYYKYATSFYKQVLANKDFYSEPTSVYSNVKGGYGIFAGYSKSVKKIVIVNKNTGHNNGS